MNFDNKPRWLIILVAAALVIGGLAIILSSNQNLASGPLFSPIPSPGYERNLSYIEIGYIGILMVGIGALLAFISIGIRKWSPYQPKEEYIEGIKTISISVATTNYETDEKVIRDVMRSAELMVHAKNEFVLSESEFKMGWHFFVLHVTPNLVHKIIDSTSSSHQAQNIKLEDRFIRWLSQKLEEKQCDVYLDLESRKGSSKYGLF